MKKISVIALAMALCMCLLSFVGCGKNEKTDSPKGMKLASSENADYCMYVPEAWRVDKSDLYTSAHVASAASPDATSISVTAFGVSAEEADVSAWWKSFEKEIGAVYEEMSEVKEKDAKLDGVKGKEFSFTAKLAEKEYNFIITAVVKDYYVYYVTYTSTPEFNEDHLEELEQVIDAFEFKD